MAVACGIYDYRIALGVFVAIAGIVGLILFYNVRTFSTIILPLYYLIIIDHVVFALVTLFIITFLADRANRANFTVQIPYPLLLSLLLAASANGAVRALDKDIGRYLFEYAFLIPIIVFVLYYNLKNSTEEITTHLTVIAAVTSIIGWISLAKWILTGIPREMFRWDSQNPAGCFMGMMLPFALISLIDAGDKKSRMFWVLVFAGVLAGILVTQTRAVLVSLMVAMLYVASKDKNILKVMLPAILVAGIALPSLIIYRLAMLLGMGDNPDWSSVGRVQIWMNSLEYIPKYFWLGMGMDSFRTKYMADFPYSFIHAKHVHNVYLKWLFDIGVFGLFAYLAIISKSLLNAMNAVKKYLSKATEADRRLLLGINGGLISCLAASLVDATLHQTPLAMLLWTFLAFQLVIVARMRSEFENSALDEMLLETGKR